MAGFVLVHGASHGAWCWGRVATALQALGHDTVAIELPGNGADGMSREDVTLADYRDAVLAHVTPGAILVGHSLGGISVTLAAASRDVQALVYVASVLPAPGQRFADIRADAIAPIVGQVSDRDGGLSMPNPDLCGPVFYSDCTPEDQAFATTRMTPQPVSVMVEPVHFTPPDVPRHYVVCARDRVVLPGYQRHITSDWPRDHVHELNTGHSPFLSDVDSLVAVLDAIQTRTT